MTVQAALFDKLPEAMSRGAAMSSCGKYRYQLWRIWEPSLPRLVVIGLNPSTADELKDDPTIRKCIGFSRRWGMGGLTMLNLFALRSTDPDALLTAENPVGGGDNDAELLRHCADAGRVLAAWGCHKAARNRGLEVCEMLGTTLYCLGTTQDGYPKHPLYIPYEMPVQVFWQVKSD